MAYSYVRYTGDGTQTNYSFSFPYIDQTHVKVRIDGVLTDLYSYLDSSIVQFFSAPVAGAVIEIRRETPKSATIVDFQNGSVLLERDLDLLAQFDLFIAQEVADLASDVMSLDSSGRWDAENKKLGNLATAVNADEAVNKGQLDYEYPLVSTVAESIANVNIVGSDLGVTTSLPVDLGSVADAATESEPSGDSKIATVAENIDAVIEVADNMAAVLEADDKAAAAAASATAAASSASAAASSQATASSAASVATSAQTAAESAATSASGSATAASTSAALASTKAGESATSATASATSASSASTSATAASGSASAAATSASNAASSASAAATSASNAASSATLAASYIPSVSGNTGKFLTNNGTTPSWTDTFDFGSI